MPRQRQASTLTALLFGALPALAQPPESDTRNIVEPRMLAAPVVREPEIGRVMVVPTIAAVARAAPANAERAGPSLSCRMVCSLFAPRQIIAHVSFPNNLVRSTEPEASSELRLDISGTPLGFREGNYGTARLSEIATAEVQAGAGLDVERLRQLVPPAFLSKVEAHRITARDPSLAPQRLRQIFVTPAAPTSLPTDLQEALQRDARTGGLEQMRLIAQGVEVVRTEPRRTVIAEGLQPGLTYGLRIVRERTADAETLVENICRVPVCPADFIEPK